jgi:hypothetical protein
MNLEVPKNGY